MTHTRRIAISAIVLGAFTGLAGRADQPPQHDHPVTSGVSSSGFDVVPPIPSDAGPSSSGAPLNHWCATGSENDARLAAREAAYAGRGVIGGFLEFEKVGGYLVVQDNGSLVSGAHAFDLGGKSLRLTRASPTAFDGSMTSSQYDPDIGTLTATWSAYGDVEIPLAPPGFPFGTAMHASLYATSNIGIYFAPTTSPGCGDDSNCMQYTQSEIELMTEPRITPLARRSFWIWTPTVELYVRNDGSSVTLTWHQVTSSVESNPEADMYFQAKLELLTGDILLSYPTASSVNAFGAVQVVTGAETGAPITDISVLENSLANIDGPILEAFTFGDFLPGVLWNEVRSLFPYNDGNLDGMAAYQTFFTDLTFYAGAYHTNGRPGVAGINANGSKRTSLMHLNQLYLSWNRTDERSISVLSHEFGHRWLYFVNGVGPSRSGAHPAMNAHLPAAYSLVTPIDSSCMGGTTWTDNLDGTFTSPDFRTYYSYSWTELYLMGFAAPVEVPDWWYIGDNPGLNGPYYPPVSTTFSGTRVDLSIGNIIAVHGARNPAYPMTQRDFRVLLVLITRPEDPLRQDHIDKMNRIASLWATAWRSTTYLRGSVEASLPELRAAGDSDGDGDVDVTDYAALFDCASGPGNTPTPAPPRTAQGCRESFDFDTDRDVDLIDAASFMTRFTGP